MGSHRVGHDWSDLAAAAAAGCVNNHHYNFKYVVILHNFTYLHQKRALK